MIPASTLAGYLSADVEPRFPHIAVAPRGPDVHAINMPNVEMADDRYVIVGVSEIDVGMRLRIVRGDDGHFRAEIVEAPAEQ